MLSLNPNQLKNKLLLLLAACLFIASCHTCPCEEEQKALERKIKNERCLSNVDVEEKTVWRVDETYPELVWSGDFLTIYDTIETYDPDLYHRFITVYHRNIREGKWTLSSDNIEYAYRYYKNDSLLRTETFLQYPDQYNNMKAVGAFDTFLIYTQAEYL